MKRILVTGAGGGLGGHIAARARESGYAVLGLGRKPPKEDPGFPFLLADVADPASVASAFRQLRGEPLWGVINAAGIASMNLLLTTPPESMVRLLHGNLLGTMYCCAEAGKLLIRGQGGRIINFSSIAVPLALAGESVYAASKAGVETFSRCLARELASFGVTVNVLAPGPIDTSLLRGLSREQVEAVVRRQILPRMATPEDVWDVAAFLLGEMSGMLTGETLHLGGV